MSEYSAAADEAARISIDEEPANGALHQRMSGYGYQSPQSLVPPGSGAGSENGHGSAERSGLGQNGGSAWGTRGYQKPSQAWLAASQAWRTQTEEQPSDVEETTSEVEETRSELQETQLDVEETRSEVDEGSSNVEQTPWNVESDLSEVEQIRSEIEHTQSRIEEIESEVEQTPFGAADTSPEAAAARLRSAPATRSFWSRFSGSGSAQAGAYPAEQTTTESPSSEADPEPAMPDAESSQLVADPSAPEPEGMVESAYVADPSPEPEPEPEEMVEAAWEADPAPEPEPEPELEPEPEPEPVAEVSQFGATQQEPETPHYLGSSSTVSPATGPDRDSELATGQDVATPPLGSPSSSAESAPSPSPAPAMPDVRLVVQAVQSAEEAALAYAREIGEARKYLSEAIAHLDRAAAARTLLNTLAAGFGS